MIDKIFSTQLSEGDQSTLLQAFENQTTHIIKLPSGIWIGVNVPVKLHDTFILTERSGMWACGTMKETT